MEKAHCKVAALQPTDSPVHMVSYIQKTKISTDKLSRRTRHCLRVVSLHNTLQAFLYALNWDLLADNALTSANEIRMYCPAQDTKLSGQVQLSLCRPEVCSGITHSILFRQLAFNRLTMLTYVGRGVSYMWRLWWQENTPRECSAHKGGHTKHNGLVM